jgi:hypothetical protein
VEAVTQPSHGSFYRGRAATGWGLWSQAVSETGKRRAALCQV